MIGSAVVKSVKDEWLKGKGENATVKIVIRDADWTMVFRRLEQSSLLAT
jgi:hypothetical protein